ncbi:MAG: DMT family transporter [Pirellulales bacterium]
MTSTETENPEDSQLSHNQGRLLIVAAAVLWSTSGLFAKSPYFNDWPLEHRGILLAFWRAAFASVILLCFVRRPNFHWRYLPLLGCFVVMNISFLSAMTSGEASNAIWLQHTAPAWVLMGSLLILRDKVLPKDWILLAFCAAGVGLILSFELQGANAWGAVQGLISGLTYAGVVLSLRYLRDEDSAWVVAFAHIVTAFCLFPYVVYQGIWPSGFQWLPLAGFGMLQMGFPYFLFALGLRKITSHEASGICLLEPILVPVWVFIAWHHSPGYQSPAWWTMAGGTLILVGLASKYLLPGKEKPRQ